MSATATQSGGYAPESQRFVDWSNFNEKPWRYVEGGISPPDTDITDVDTQNATAIRYDKDCRQNIDKRKKFERLSEYNSGLRNGKWVNQGYNTHLLNEHLIWSLISQLDLNPRYHQEAASLFLSLDLSKFGVDAGIVAYCTCAVVVHRAEQNERDCHPSVKDIDSKFQMISECEGYRKKDLISIYNKISQSTDKYRD
jgi:hypothetical protein